MGGAMLMGERRVLRGVPSGGLRSKGVLEEEGGMGEG